MQLQRAREFPQEFSVGVFAFSSVPSQNISLIQESGAKLFVLSSHCFPKTSSVVRMRKAAYCNKERNVAYVEVDSASLLEWLLRPKDSQQCEN